MTGELWAAAVLGALLALDHAACVSLLVSQPVVTAALFGALLGHFESAAAAGALVQLVWMVTLPVGGARLPELWLGGAAAAAAAPAVLPHDWLGSAAFTPAVVVGVATALVAAPLLAAQRRWQSARAGTAVARARAGDFEAVARSVWAALGVHAVRGAIAAVVTVVAAPRVASALSGGLAGVHAGWVAIALGVVALTSHAPRRRVPLWLAGALAGSVFAWTTG
jgi:mannose/fructose/N-acetylgalactosamine-specific phosphotransferase system component IIC